MRECACHLRMQKDVQVVVFGHIVGHDLHDLGIEWEVMDCHWIGGRLSHDVMAEASGSAALLDALREFVGKAPDGLRVAVVEADVLRTYPVVAVPPRQLSRSISNVRAPLRDAATAAIRPDAPPPATTTS